ncbi:Pimeloyl-ACP methyl ester carboxylesterase [Hymenobacter gelipurpurascens]|uniref:Pimeloyl-ACP methyl ester carboxylesterase n=1 Tax=Hymenobacter gelipurpurascens TaxID=89968 RepID=A0A212UC94_9BACT|nr:alpha/beta hydrolase [Hymenobacter gelipurpurascens]SNC75813.1 Pimeloyl-ACP methyl ester carboxylesterase [Hymenobacter gelipurpurascens]
MPTTPTIVFLHGFAESRAIWTEFTRGFSKDYQLLLLDLLGHGENTEGVQDYSMEAQASYVAEQLQQQSVTQALVVGHSMGGYVALALAEAHPEMVSGLVLFHSTALPDTDEKKANRDKNHDFVQRHGVKKFMDSFIRPLFAPANRDRLPEAQTLLEDIGKATPKATILGGLEAMKNRPDRTQVLKNAQFPVLFIGGQDDVAVAIESLLPQLALPAQSHALLLADVGHLGYLERPMDTRRAIEQFAEVVFGK